MLNIDSGRNRFWIIASITVLLLAAAAVVAQTEDMDPPDPDVVEEETANAENPPGYINDLVENSDLTPEQVETMRVDGMGWGNIKTAAELAEAISAGSTEAEPISYDQALELVLADRAQEIGFGEIAEKYNLKIGELNRNRIRTENAGAGGPAVEKPAKAERPEKMEKPEKPVRPERPEKPEKPEKPERPERGPGK